MERPVGRVVGRAALPRADRIFLGALDWLEGPSYFAALRSSSISRALRVSTDELLGVTPVRDTLSPKTAQLLKRLRRIEELPPADQRALLKLVDAMLDTRRRTAPAPARAKRKAS